MLIGPPVPLICCPFGDEVKEAIFPKDTEPKFFTKSGETLEDKTRLQNGKLNCNGIGEINHAFQEVQKESTRMESPKLKLV